MKNSIILDPSSVLDSSLIAKLMKDFGFDERGLRSNLKLFRSVIDAGHDICDFLDSISKLASQANSPQGYVIRALQNLLSGITPFKMGMNIKKVNQVPDRLQKNQKTPKKHMSRLSVSSADAFSDSDIEEL